MGDALKDVTPSTRTPASQKVKESKLLLDLERKQKQYGTIQPTINEADVEPQEPKTVNINTNKGRWCKRFISTIEWIKKVNIHEYQQQMMM